MLEILKEQFGLNCVNRPTIARSKSATKVPIGTLRDLSDYILSCPEGKVVEVDYNALTASNVSAISQSLKSRGYKLHCVKNADKRIMWAEQEN